MGDAGASAAGGSPAAAAPIGGEGGSGLKEQFGAFSRFGDSTSDGKQITLSNCDKWMKQAHVIDGKKITTTDTSIAFKKLFKTAKKVGFEDFKRYVEDLGKSKGMEGKDILEKLANCGPPGHSQATKAAHAGVVSRLTDTSKYTGSHKERFDASGRGRGIEGRRDVQDSSGYVAAFKAKRDSQSPTPK